ncbi:hypothetical protein [Pseudomonas sp. DG56-2]|uniref:hypothetical protein n=1 Tax=Pseudomonas sp. DG56-2 TaxID=2320270 RepID=UPI0010A6A00F|nr:hypothetical protein [Pseudomonas sp. DG56-2]
MRSGTRLDCARPVTADIHDIAERRPHLTVAAVDGVHVLPCDLVRSVIAGDKPSAILTEPVLRRIIEEWLQKVTV